MREKFLSLNKKQMGMVTGRIQDALLFYQGYGDGQELLRSYANRSAGKVKEIYMELSRLSDDEFEIFSAAITE